MENFIWIFLLGLAMTIALIATLIHLTNKKTARIIQKLEQKKKKTTFSIKYSQGQYFVFKDGFCIKCCGTYEEAKEWLDKNKELYSIEDKVLYSEKY